MQRTQSLTVQLPDCCRDELRQIGRIIDSATALRRLMIPLVFMQLLTHPIGALFVVLTTDWETLSEAMKVIPSIARRRCFDVAQMHWLEHPGGDLERFWRAMFETFE